MLLSIFTSSLDINSSFHWSCSWRSFTVVRLSSFRGFSLLRSSVRICSIFVGSALNPCQLEINFFSSAIVSWICHSTKLYWVMTIVSVPVSVPKSYLLRIRLRYTEVPQTIDKAEKDSDPNSASYNVSIPHSSYACVHTKTITKCYIVRTRYLQWFYSLSIVTKIL